MSKDFDEEEYHLPAAVLENPPKCTFKKIPEHEMTPELREKREQFLRMIEKGLPDDGDLILQEVSSYHAASEGGSFIEDALSNLIQSADVQDNTIKFKHRSSKILGTLQAASKQESNSRAQHKIIHLDDFRNGQKLKPS